MDAAIIAPRRSLREFVQSHSVIYFAIRQPEGVFCGTEFLMIRRKEMSSSEAISFDHHEASASSLHLSGYGSYYPLLAVIKRP
jgi:hypothetical protein